MPSLEQLRAEDLRAELKKRNLPATGRKQELKERLREAVISAGENPETAEFQTTKVSDLNSLFQAISEQNDKTQKQNEEIKERIDSQRVESRQQIEEMKQKFQVMESAMEKRMEEIEALKQRQENIETDVLFKIKEMKDGVDKGMSEIDKKMKLMEEEYFRIRSINNTTESQQYSNPARMKPPEFDGQVSWSVYKKQFEAAAQINKWITPEEKATALILALRGPASELLQTVDQRNYNALVKALELRYGDEHLQDVHRVQLKTRQQKMGESLQELESDIERLAHLSYPTATTEFLHVITTDAFIDAIRDPELKKAVRLSGKRTSSEALVYALSYEAAGDASRSRSHVRELTLSEIEVEKVRKLINQSDRPAQNESQFRTPRKGQLQCWNCQQYGHVQKYCDRAPRFRQSDRRENEHLHQEN